MLCVGLPSYNRPSALRLSLASFLFNGAELAVVVADASDGAIAEEYRAVTGIYNERVVAEVGLGRRGSVGARNRVLELAAEAGCDPLVMADDDYVLLDSRTLELMMLWTRADDVGAVGGRVVNLIRRAVDPDFFLNLRVADALSLMMGYVFLDVANGPRSAAYLTPFFALRGDLLAKVRYDRLYESPTAFREESDIQEQVRRLGYLLVFEPRAWVTHLALEYGGNRSEIEERARMRFKARGAAAFIAKWYRGAGLISRLLASTLLMLAYRPWMAAEVLAGVRDGVMAASASLKGDANFR